METGMNGNYTYLRYFGHRHNGLSFNFNNLMNWNPGDINVIRFVYLHNKTKTEIEALLDCLDWLDTINAKD
ncbi:CLUMA_CG000663, isoform A [Clunio marinus]|uniref:CLUMA_CG000663, isoform A n=1 Tax=Clunio marinus TaxID=568069 RepID=A0A1J1HG42_9DIPT|nr:CLUMA_CG000663, isoform A [Clunio marinus]